MKKIFNFIIISLCVFLLSGCVTDNNDQYAPSNFVNTYWQTEDDCYFYVSEEAVMTGRMMVGKRLVNFQFDYLYDEETGTTIALFREIDFEGKLSNILFTAETTFLNGQFTLSRVNGDEGIIAQINSWTFTQVDSPKFYNGCLIVINNNYYLSPFGEEFDEILFAEIECFNIDQLMYSFINSAYYMGIEMGIDLSTYLFKIYQIYTNLQPEHIEILFNEISLFVQEIVAIIMSDDIEITLIINDIEYTILMPDCFTAILDGETEIDINVIIVELIESEEMALTILEKINQESSEAIYAAIEIFQNTITMLRGVLSS